MHTLTRETRKGVTLVGSFNESLRFGFTERSGGVSKEPYSSLNLGTHVGDVKEDVLENRRRVLEFLGAEDYFANLLVPNQVHGTEVVVVRDSSAKEISAVNEMIAEGADAIVCTTPHVPVLLNFADCVPVIMVAKNGFAVVHSGWKGTLNNICAKALGILCLETNTQPKDVEVFIGPHILGDEYQVSPELMLTFSLQFDNIENADSRLLDLGACIRLSLENVGVQSCSITDTHLSTMRLNDRFFSYRLEKGNTGRHGAIAFMQE